MPTLTSRRRGSVQEGSEAKESKESQQRKLKARKQSAATPFEYPRRGYRATPSAQPTQSPPKIAHERKARALRPKPQRADLGPSFGVASETSSDTSEAAALMERMYGVANMRYGDYVQEVLGGPGASEAASQAADFSCNSRREPVLVPHSSGSFTDTRPKELDSSSYCRVDEHQDPEYDSENSIQEIIEIDRILAQRDNVISMEKDALLRGGVLLGVDDTERKTLEELLREDKEDSSDDLGYAIEVEDSFSPRVDKTEITDHERMQIEMAFLTCSQAQAQDRCKSSSLPISVLPTLVDHPPSVNRRLNTSTKSSRSQGSSDPRFTGTTAVESDSRTRSLSSRQRPGGKALRGARKSDDTASRTL